MDTLELKHLIDNAQTVRPVAAHHHHRGAHLRQPVSSGLANPQRCARHQANFPVHVSRVHALLSFFSHLALPLMD